MIKKLIFIILFFICSIFCFSQEINIEPFNKVIDMTYYKSYYNNDIQAPSFVIYKLYKGGGDISRSVYSFRSYQHLPHFNYTNSGYDRGHLVPAEDFANDKDKLKSTFYYINCIPQTIKLNRSTWRVYENQIRKLSQKDSLIIMCGGGNFKGLVPQKCFKLVYNLRTKKLVHSLVFYNNESGGVIIDYKLYRKIPYSKVMDLYNK